MKPILIKIANILWSIPNMSDDVGATIMNPIDTEEQAERLLNFLKDNKGNKEIMRVTYLLRYNHEIIGN